MIPSTFEVDLAARSSSSQCYKAPRVLRRGLRLWWSMLVWALACTAAPAAAAHAAHLEWTAPASCPDAALLRASVERLLGAPLLESEDFVAEAEVTLDPDGRFTLVLTLRSPEGTGTRTVRAETCEGALNVAAFGIALALNPELALAPPPEAVPVPPAPPSLPPAPAARTGPERPAPPARAKPAADPDSHTAPELWLGARAVLDSALLPAPAAGFGAFADVLVLGRWRFGAGGQWLVPQRHLLEDGDGGWFASWTVDAHACFQASRALPVAACSAFHFGRVRGEGRGVTPSLTQETSLLAPGLAVLGLPALSERLSAVVGASVLFPLGRDSFVVDAGEVHEIPVFSLQLAAGISLRVP